MSVAQVEQALPPDTTYVVYDLSLPVTGKDPRYGTSEGGTNRDWIIVAACGSIEQLAVGVLSTADYDTKTADSAKAGEFDSLLTEC